ncbi:MAG: hypothetical protein K2K96_02085 [Lachnospiraceae bacterium]|nr:hypothetical protein [Lachnospiraceae bacterium]
MNKERIDKVSTDDDLFRKVLSCALTAEEIPSRELNEQLLLKAKERNKLKREEMIHQKRSSKNRNKRKFHAAAVIVAAVLCISSISAVAAWKYLLPQQVAEHQSGVLAEAFAGEDAITVNEVQEIAGYRITFLGVVTGKGLSSSIFMNGQEVERDSTYTVVAIENLDGSPMADTSADAYGDIEFFVTPAVRGYDPVWYNAITLTGENGTAGYMDVVENGILYRLSECHNMEVFADRELYLCVSESTFYDNQAYLFDRETGELSRNPDYGKVNALFSLPLDPAKANPIEAERILEAVDVPDMTEENVDEEDIGQESDIGSPYLLLNMTEEEKAALIQEAVDMQLTSLQEAAAGNLTQAEIDAAAERATKIQTYIMQVRIAMLSGDSIDEYADCLESTVQIVTPDEDGMLHYSYDLENGGAGSGSFNVIDCIEEYPEFSYGFIPGCFGWSASEDGMEDLRMETFWLNADGTVTFAVYVPKEEYK